VSEPPDFEEWTVAAEGWLEANAKRRPPKGDLVWGQGSDSVALFKNLAAAEEKALIDAARAWQRQKAEAGYGSITWPVEYGGAGLPRQYEVAFDSKEAQFDTPETHESVSITWNLIGPTILTCGTEEQKARYLRPLRRAEEMWCQLFSEPGAGSDLAGLQTRAERDGDTWVINGQKVWTSGAQYAHFGYIQTRTDPTAAKHAGMTAFLLPMDAPGVEVRPLRQMSGGSSFNEVFLTDVHLPDSARLGEVNAGWNVAVTTLGFERMAASRGVGGSGPDLFERIVLLAGELGRRHDPIVRQRLASIYTARRVRGWTNQRAAAKLKANGVPGPEGSIAKLASTEALRDLTHAVAELLGPRIAADTGEWGTYAWGEMLCGLPGYRVAGGTDEIQRNIIAERALGLPREPKL
jgi:alkylation response protein AidB-like acyl-CoA dehydrogenase